MQLSLSLSFSLSLFYTASRVMERSGPMTPFGPWSAAVNGRWGDDQLLLGLLETVEKRELKDGDDAFRKKRNGD